MLDVFLPSSFPLFSSFVLLKCFVEAGAPRAGTSSPPCHQWDQYFVFIHCVLKNNN